MRFFVFLLALSCTSEEAVKVHNSVPTVTITSHTGDELFQDGYSVMFLAQVQDDNHDNGSLNVGWYSDVRTLCEEQTPTIDGVSQCSTSLEEGESAGVCDPGVLHGDGKS